MTLENRVAVITGCGGGIGREVALSLAKEKCKIAMLGGNNLAKLKESQSLVLEQGGICEIFPCDLTSDKGLGKAFDKLIKSFGKIDILINNAGLAHSSNIEQTEVQLFDKIMNINARVPFVLTQKALPYLEKSDRASVINIASVVSHAGYPLQSAYTASKHALLGFTKSLAQEVYERGIRVHAISPGGVFTDMIKVSRPDLDGKGMITSQEIAEIVCFLLKNRGNAVIDEIIVHRIGKTPFLV